MYFIQFLASILSVAILIRSVLSWFPVDPASPWVKVLHDITEPVLAPLRRIVPRVGMIDVTPMVAIILLTVVTQAVSRSG